MLTFDSGAIYSQSSDWKQCYKDLKTDRGLAPLQGKIVFTDIGDPSIEMLTNNQKPNKVEKVALLRWDALLTQCMKSTDEKFISDLKELGENHCQNGKYISVCRNAQKLLTATTNAINLALINMRILTAELYSGKITYGDFATKRVANTEKNQERIYQILANNRNDIEQEQAYRDAEDDRTLRQRQAILGQFLMSRPSSPAPIFIPQNTYTPPVQTNCFSSGNSVNCTSQ